MANTDLRPMSIGEVLDRTFSLYKSHFWLFAGIMALPFLVLFVVNVVVAGLQAARAGIVQVSNSPHAAGPVSPGLIEGAVGGAILVGLLYFVLIGAAQAATIFAVSDLYLGRAASVRGSFRRVRGHVLRVLGVLFLTSLVVGVGFILLIIPGIILLCRTGVAVPASMLEDEGPVVSISRSMELTKGYALQMFLIFLLAWVLSIVAAAVFQFPFTLLMGTAAKPHAVSLALVVIQDFSSFVSQVLVGPVATIAFSLMYYNLRVRKEAFDLQHLMGSLGSGTTPSAPGAVLPA
jgi:hypothetical protein